MAMTREEKAMLQRLEKDIAQIKNYTSNLGGSLEFKKIVQRYVTDPGGVLLIQGSLEHTGTTVGFFGTSPVSQQPDISAPTGQANDLDSEARSAIVDILNTLDAYGLTA